MKDFGFGKKSSEAEILAETEELLKEIRKKKIVQVGKGFCEYDYITHSLIHILNRVFICTIALLHHFNGDLIYLIRFDCNSAIIRVILHYGLLFSSVAPCCYSNILIGQIDSFPIQNH